MRRRSIVATVLVVASCGGRYLEAGDTSYDVAGGPNATGGSASQAGGKSGTGGSKAGRAGAGSVGGTTASTGGTAGGKAGASGGGGCACDPIGCAPGYRRVPNADGCCYHCEKDDSMCDVARQDYAQFRAAVVAKYNSLGCRIDSECTVYYDSNACGSSCGVPVPAAFLQEVDSILTGYTTCNDCPPVPIPPCEPPALPRCVANRCQ